MAQPKKPKELKDDYPDVEGKDFVKENKVIELQYSNNLNDVMNKHNIKQDKMAHILDMNTGTISKHRNGKSPIGWDTAQMYSKYFIVHHDIMVDAFTLLTGKQKPDDELYSDTLAPGRIPIVGQFVHTETKVHLFDHTVPPMRLTSKMYNHYIFRNAEEWGLKSLIYVDGNLTDPFTKVEDFYYQDYQYWIILGSPIVQRHIHKGSHQNLCICKLKGEDTILAGTLYEKPRRNQQAPITYELIDPYWSTDVADKNNFIAFTPRDRNLNGIELDWATPVISIVLNPNASGVFLEQNGDVQ